jgi:hypothetical protein
VDSSQPLLVGNLDSQANEELLLGLLMRDLGASCLQSFVHICGSCSEYEHAQRQSDGHAPRLRFPEFDSSKDADYAIKYASISR